MFGYVENGDKRLMKFGYKFGCSVTTSTIKKHNMITYFENIKLNIIYVFNTSIFVSIYKLISYEYIQ